jgi:hypothetical protein
MLHELTPDMHLPRFEKCGQLPGIVETREFDSFRVLVTANENWILFEYQHSTKCSLVRDEVPTSVSQTVGTRKAMLTMIWELDGFHVVDTMPPGSFSAPSTSLLVLLIHCR